MLRLTTLVPALLTSMWMGPSSASIFCDGGADLGFVADVAGEDEGAAAVVCDALGEGLEDFLAAGDHGYMRAGGCEFQRDCLAEAAAGAGYDYVLTGKISQCMFSFCGPLRFAWIWEIAQA